MKKEEKAELPDKNPKMSVNQDDSEANSDVVEETYAAKSFIRNLSASMGKDPASLYPEKADKIFKINELVDLRLINNKTYIYINNNRFVQCFNVILNIGTDKQGRNENIRNMDEVSRFSSRSYGQWFAKISPEEEFMAHCSNIQAFFENELNTDLLHSDISFPLLKKLVSLGFKPALLVFNKEIIKRYNEGTWETRKFLELEGYLKYLNKEERHTLIKDKHFKRYIESLYPKTAHLKRDKKTLDATGEKSIRVFEYNDAASEFSEIESKFPLSSLLDSTKILLFDNPLQNIVWVWIGFDTTTQMKYFAKKLIPQIIERHEIGFKVKYIDEGFEPVEFNIMIKKIKEPGFERVKEDPSFFESLSKEKILYLIEKLKKSEGKADEIEIGGKKYDIREIKRIFLGIELTETQISPKADLNLFFITVKEGVTKIKTIMKERSTEELTLHRKDLPEIFNRDLLIFAKIDGYPIFIPGVTKCFELMGILTIIYGNIIKFFKINQD